MPHSEVIQIPVLNDNYTYVLHFPESRSTAAETVVVDPAVAEPVLDVLEARGWPLSKVLNTHHHPDHTGGNVTLREKTGCDIVGNRHDAARLPGLTIGVEGGDRLTIGDHEWQVMDVPGHTIGHIAYYDQVAAALYCGDTLFSLGCGRLFEGTPEQMWQSLMQIRQLPAETTVYCAHEYTLANAAFAETIDPENRALKARILEIKGLREKGQPTIPMALGDEIQANPFLRADDASLAARLKTQVGVETFAEIRSRKDRF